MTALENLRYLSALAGVARDDHGWQQLLEGVGLRWSDAQRRVGSFSKGMRQKVGIALALARDADVLLLDEPSSGLDPVAARELEVMVRRYAEDGGAVLMVTHDLFRARQTGHRVGIMRDGRLLTMLSTTDIDAARLEHLYLDQQEVAA
jgi:ABC-2 type transport system ATP-binding protein